MKKVLKMTIGLKGSEIGENPLPQWMEDEEPGVFGVKVMEVDWPEEGLGHGMFTKWLLDQEDEAIKESIEIRWFEEVPDEPEDSPA